MSRADAARAKAKAQPGDATAALFDRKKQFNARRALILSEATKLFNERGFLRCSVEDIAERLGIAKTAVYYYFNSKDQILFEAYLKTFEVADAALDEATEVARSGREKLERYIRSWLLNGVAAGGHILPMRDLHALPDDMRRTLDEKRRSRRDKLRAIVAEGIADGSIRPCNPKVVISAWGGALAWILESYRPDGELSFEEITDEMVTVFMHGLATDAPAKR